MSKRYGRDAKKKGLTFGKVRWWARAACPHIVVMGDCLTDVVGANLPS